MNRIHVVVLALVLIFTVRAYADPDPHQLGVYVVVSDLERSIEFYEGVFGLSPYFTSNVFAAFGVSGSVFGLYTEAAYSRDLTRGNSTVTYVRVSDIDSEFERIRQLGVTLEDQSVLDEGPISLFMFKDPDGNAIEFYSLPEVGG